MKIPSQSKNRQTQKKTKKSKKQEKKRNGLKTIQAKKMISSNYDNDLGSLQVCLDYSNSEIAKGKSIHKLAMVKEIS